MTDSSSSESGGGIGTVGWVLIIIVGIITLPYLIGFVLGVAGVALAAAWGAIGAVLGALGTAFGLIIGALSGLLGLLISFSFVLLLLLPGILIGLLLAKALGGRKAG